MDRDSWRSRPCPTKVAQACFSPYSATPLDSQWQLAKGPGKNWIVPDTSKMYHRIRTPGKQNSTPQINAILGTFGKDVRSPKATKAVSWLQSRPSLELSVLGLPPPGESAQGRGHPHRDPTLWTRCPRCWERLDRNQEGREEPRSTDPASVG